MSACCVSGCKNRHSSSSKLKFYRIPSKCRPFQANRRRLWLQAIQRVNGCTDELRDNARICGAHFISGEASMDHDSADFVPSVFPCTKPKLVPKKKVKRIYGRRRSRRRKANVTDEEKTCSSDSPLDVSMEEIETLSSSEVPKEEETLTRVAETETETETSDSPTASSPNKTPETVNKPAGILKLGKKFPSLVLKSVFAPASGYQCELCSHNFAHPSQLIKHKELHEAKVCGKLFTAPADFSAHQPPPKPSFPCNMCDRSYTTNHNLKRHKLRHVKDGRKCGKCGVIFCQLHNHVLYVPRVEPAQESDAAEPDRFPGATVTPAQTASPKTENPLPDASHTRVINKIPVPKLIKPLNLRVPWQSRVIYPDPIQPNLRQLPDLPPALKLFSPQCLTSRLLQVERNYDYILGNKKPRDEKTVKEEPCELPLIPPDEHERSAAAHIKRERTAYDLEIVL